MSYLGNVDKSGIIWQQFNRGIKKRKNLILRIKDAALEGSTPIPTLKKLLVDIRQITLTVVEDALEIEYRSRMFDSNSSIASSSAHSVKLPPISSYRTLKENEDVFALAEMVHCHHYVMYFFHFIRILIIKLFIGK